MKINPDDKMRKFAAAKNRRQVFLLFVSLVVFVGTHFAISQPQKQLRMLLELTIEEKEQLAKELAHHLKQQDQQPLAPPPQQHQEQQVAAPVKDQGVKDQGSGNGKQQQDQQPLAPPPQQHQEQQVAAQVKDQGVKDQGSGNGKRWAVMMIGEARSYAACRDSFVQNVVKQTDAIVDVFVYSVRTKDPMCQIDALGVQRLTEDSTVIHFDEHFVKHTPDKEEDKTYDRFVRQQVEHWDLMEQYSLKHNITYDYVLYTRPDILYTGPLDMKFLERRMDKYPDEWWQPGCCAFGGFCDRVAVSTWGVWRKIILSSPEWYKVAKERVFELAFEERAVFAGLNYTFQIPKEAYSFATLRTFNIQQACQDGFHKFKNIGPDAVCSHRGKSLTSFLNVDEATCDAVKTSDCPSDHNFKKLDADS